MLGPPLSSAPPPASGGHRGWRGGRVARALGSGRRRPAFGRGVCVSTSFSNTRSTLKCNPLMHFIETFYKELIKKKKKKEKKIFLVILEEIFIKKL